MKTRRTRQSVLFEQGKRYCPSCNTVKDISEFGRNARYKSGLQTYCRDCAKNKSRVRLEAMQPIERWAYTVANSKQALREKEGVPCDIDAEYLYSIYPKDGLCPVLGIELHPKFDGKSGPRNSSPTVDRLDPMLGYVKGNVAIISLKANRFKNNATLCELKRLVSWLDLTLAV